MSVSTIGVGVDTKIPSPERSTKQPLPGIELHDPLHGRQACPEFNSFHQGVGQISPGRAYFRAVPSKNGGKVVTSPPPQSLNDSDLELIRGVETRMQGYAKLNPRMEIKAAGDNIFYGTAQVILLVLVAKRTIFAEKSNCR